MAAGCDVRYADVRYIGAVANNRRSPHATRIRSMRRVRALIPATLLVWTLGACAGGGAPPVAPPPSAGEEGAASQEPSADLERLEELYRARADSARLEVSEADVSFMTGMIHHHAQALVMSALARTNGASASIRTLTGRIINAQTDEIAVMQRWLRERGRPVPEVGPDGRMVGMGEHAMHMPGMLSAEQLDALTRARGREFDRLFLSYMIQHHNGAVDMVHELFATDGAAQDDFVFKIASDIQVDQTTEVARMQRMLDAMSPGRLR